MTKITPEQWWRGLLTGENPALPVRHFRHVLKLIPTGPRCEFCNAPYHGIGAPILRILGKGSSRLTPQLCTQCHSYASRYLGGAEVELTMLFADIRGSTSLAEKMSPAQFGDLISCFLAVASDVIIRSQAILDRLVGDANIATDITVLGDAANTAARLSSSAAAGEIPISENALDSKLNVEGLETRRLELEGKSQPVNVYVLKDYSG